jgi:hypothetical protein
VHAAVSWGINERATGTPEYICTFSDLEGPLEGCEVKSIWVMMVVEPCVGPVAQAASSPLVATAKTSQIGIRITPLRS